MRKKHELIQFFGIAHLPTNLQDLAGNYLRIANFIDETTTDSLEKTECLRKLLESKDAAVRSFLYKKPEYNELRLIEEVI